MDPKRGEASYAIYGFRVQGIGSLKGHLVEIRIGAVLRCHARSFPTRICQVRSLETIAESFHGFLLGFKDFGG